MTNWLDALGSLLAWLRKRRRISPKPNLVKVNLGCGLSIAEDWINVDISLYPVLRYSPRWLLRRLYRKSSYKKRYSEADYIRILKTVTFVQHNLLYGIPIIDSSVDFLYSSHFLDTLPKEAAEDLLRDAFRVLKPGGRIRICLCDLEFVVSLYRKGEKDRVIRLLYPRYGSAFLERTQMFDFEMLQRALDRAGFVEVERRGFQEGHVPDLLRLDWMPEQTLFVEAVKP